MHLVGELDLAEAHGLLHPVRPEVGRVRVHVDGVGGGGLRLAARHPVPVHVLPPVVVDGDEVENEGVHGVGVKAADAAAEDGEHAPVGEASNG